MSSDGQWHDGELVARISTTVVRALARTTGRGPAKAKTTLGDNGVFVVLQDSLTRGEQTLVDAGESVAVLDLRRRWQRVMQADVSREIEELTGRKVIGFMSDNHIDPDIAVEVFVLEPLPLGRVALQLTWGDARASCPGGRTGERWRGTKRRPCTHVREGQCPEPQRLLRRPSSVAGISRHALRLSAAGASAHAPLDALGARAREWARRRRRRSSLRLRTESRISHACKRPQRGSLCDQRLASKGEAPSVGEQTGRRSTAEPVRSRAGSRRLRGCGQREPSDAPRVLQARCGARSWPPDRR